MRIFLIAGQLVEKELSHYYTDGGLKKGVAVSAFLRKKYGTKPREVWRRYPWSKGYSTTDAEYRAIELAIEDAIQEGIPLQAVVIHTDQKNLQDFWNLDPSSKPYAFRAWLQELGVSVVYSKSTHNLEEFEGLPLKDVPAKFRNALTVHQLVNRNFKTLNRYQLHKLEKRYGRKK